MRISIMVGTPEMQIDDGFLVSVLTGPFQRSLATARDLGYDGVELLMCRPDKVDVEELSRLLDENSLALAAVNSARMLTEDDVHLFHSDLALAQEARRRVIGMLHVAGCFGASVNIGLSRGVERPGTTVEEAMEHSVPVFRNLADEAKKSGSHLMIEPVSRSECQWINSTQEGLELMSMVDHPGFVLQFDFYNMLEEGEDLDESIHLAAGSVFHVHCFDSNRWPPGHADAGGTVDFAATIEALKATSYQGFLSVVLTPSGDQMAGARRTSRFLRSLIES